MEKENEVKSLLQSALVEIYNSEKFCESYLQKAQKLGLQGEKRRLRYLSVIWHNLKNYLHCDYFDLFGASLESGHSETPPPTVASIQDFFKKTCSHFEKMYDFLHGIANKLMPANGYCYATCFLEKCNCIAEYIKEYRRIIMEGEAAGWSAEYIQRLLIHQTTWHNVHDCFEEKEKEVGYNY